MTQRIYLNNQWRFTEKFTEELCGGSVNLSNLKEVRVPHTVKETPFNYFDESIYQMVSGYAKVIKAEKDWEGKSVRITFEGVGHSCEVFLNGKSVASHNNGYTAFTVNLTNLLIYGEDNLLVLKVDSNETINQPPFGYVIDYMTYGGIYRNVYLEISESTYISDAFHYSEIDNGEATLFTELSVEYGDVKNIKISQFLDGKELDLETAGNKLIAKVGKIDLWDIENPNLYEVKTVITGVESGKAIDEKVVKFGFRTSEFREDGYYLNGRRVRIRGLNRHQSYPYVGYAMPDSMQINDANILKHELGLNAVRTSHYPQSQAFIDRCDEIGLLVFTEMPGWQHIGNDDWKDIAVKNVEEMVVQYRNHPSIILWGVRINESPDDDEFYKRTNACAHKFDPTRPTGGVRCFKKSNLLEDVYTYNDFVHDGKAPGCDKKKDVTSDVNRPYLVTEYGGHMYPTKSFDWEEHRREHALRHARVLNAVAGEEGIAGSFGWCMFDYNTHKDFGSGDRICYHGVLDMFRNPKLAAGVYSSEADEEDVLLLSSSMDIGEHPACNRGEIFIFSNADSVKMYKNDRFIKEYLPTDSEFKNLKHGPILIDDFIGDALEVSEADKPAWARKILKDAMNATARYGLPNLPKRYNLKFARLILFAHMKPSDAVALYNKYVGDWGGEATVYRFDAIKNGKVVKSLIKEATKGVHLSVDADHTKLVDSYSYDTAAIRIRVLDDHNNQVSFFNEPVTFAVTGPIEIVGPSTVGVKGGMSGTYVRTTGEAGKATLTISNSQCESVTVEFEVSK